MRFSRLGPNPHLFPFVTWPCPYQTRSVSFAWIERSIRRIHITHCHSLVLKMFIGAFNQNRLIGWMGIEVVNQSLESESVVLGPPTQAKGDRYQRALLWICPSTILSRTRWMLQQINALAVRSAQVSTFFMDACWLPRNIARFKPMP